jgi:hypothetical protein
LDNGLPNQDALGWLALSVAGNPVLIVAASDGHGSATYFRSQEGSRLAVQAAIAQCQNLLVGQPDLQNFSAIKRTAEERLPKAIARDWGEAVDLHAAEHPPAPEELEHAIARSSKGLDRAALEAKPRTWYGATLLAAVFTDRFLLFLSLGDGEILTVSENPDGTSLVDRPFPLPPLDQRIGDDTFSLCQKNAWGDFRVAFQVLSDPNPKLVLMTTDGYPKAFSEDEGFLKAATDFFDLIRRSGAPSVDEKLEGVLAQASDFSGDDISLALVYRSGKMSPLMSDDAMSEPEPKKIAATDSPPSETPTSTKP